MDQNGQLVSYDNRRLVAAHNADLDTVPVEQANPEDTTPGSNKTWEGRFSKA